MNSDRAITLYHTSESYLITVRLINHLRPSMHFISLPPATGEAAGLLDRKQTHTDGVHIYSNMGVFDTFVYLIHA